MQLDSPLYQKAFQRYLRSGVTVAVQLEAAKEVAGEILFRKALQSSSIGRTVVAGRIAQLREQFDAAGRTFPDKSAPDTAALELLFEQQHRALLDKYATRPENVLPADWKQKLEAAETFMTNRFKQQIDPIVQPHYGVQYFVWTGGGENSCANCSAHQGQTFPWSGGDHPPGCAHCQCSAEPDLDVPYDPPIESVYPFESILLLMSGGEAIAMLRNAIAAWRGASAVNEQYQQAINAIEEYFGGPPEKTFRNPKEDIVMMAGRKKIRFDVNNKGHGYDEHFHIEELNADGDWIDATSQHMHPFRKE